MGSPPVRKKTTFYLTLHSYTLILSYLQTLCIHGIACVQCAWPYLNGQDPTLRITGFENLVRIPPSELREVVYLGLATTFFVVVVVIWSSKTPCVRAHGLPSIRYRSYDMCIHTPYGYATGRVDSLCRCACRMRTPRIHSTVVLQ